MKFNNNSHFPYTYGDRVENDNSRFSDLVVKVAKNKKVQNIGNSILWITWFVGSNSVTASAIPIEYGEAASQCSETLSNTAAAAAAGPDIGKIEGLVNKDTIFIPKMTPEQQRIIGAQQAGKIGAIPTPIGPQIPAKDVPWYLLPGKPKTTTERAIATGLFFASTVTICAQSAWNPIAAAMCGTGLIIVAYNIGSEITTTIVKILVNKAK